MKINRSALLFAAMLGIVVLIVDYFVTSPILEELMNASTPKGEIDVAKSIMTMLMLLIPLLLFFLKVVLMYAVIGAFYVLIRSRKTSVQIKEAMFGGMLTGLLAGFIGEIIVQVMSIVTHPEMYFASEPMKMASDAVIGIALSTFFGGFFGWIGGASGTSFVQRFYPRKPNA